MYTQAFSPEQSAHGQLENGRDILILYVKEFADQLEQVNQEGMGKFHYQWFANEDKSEYVLHVEWENGVHVSIRFNPAHKQLLDYLIYPRDVILTAIPITDLIESNPKGDFLDFNGPVASFNNLIFTDPDTLTQ